MPLILPGNVASATASTTYTVDNSCRFNGDAYMHKDYGTATLSTKCTFSIWVKPQVSDNRNTFIAAGVDGGDYMKFRFQDDKLALYGNRSDSNDLHVVTTRVFRDPSAFYHIVLQIDTTQGTAADRVKFFVNGVEETSRSTTMYMAQNATVFLSGPDNNTKVFIGAFDTAAESGADEHGEGYFAEVALIDGSILAPTEFGEYDEDSPTIWKPKDISELTFGTNGFYLDFEDSANLGNDANGGTDFTEASLDATDQATDTPTNNFCTMNPLDNYYPEATFSQGNCYVVTSGSHAGINNANFGLSSGKWYWEMKVVSATASNWQAIGVSEGPGLTDEDYTGDTANAWGWWGYTNGPIYNNDSEESASGVTNTTGDILGCYVDLDNNKIYWAKNGTLISETGKTLTASASTANGFYFPSCTDWAGAASATLGFNFGGSPAFTVSSGNADANGYGNFEYNPSTGTFDSASKDFLAICTKNLAEYG